MFSFLNPNDSYLKQKQKTVSQINQQEEKFKNLSQEEIKNKIQVYKQLAQQNTSLDQLLVDAFALTKIASARTLKQRHFDVQVLGGIALHEGKVIEMKTGEGKTLVATLPAVLNALRQKGVHVITVNDYLAKRDTVWMGQIYDYLGLTTACITQEGAFLYDPNYYQDESSREERDKIRDELGSFHIEKSFLKPTTKQEAYQADITYGTNTEFGFDYLRDNLVTSLEEKTQKNHYYAIIDEVDSVLIDEARTPLIISVPDEEASKLYQQFASLAYQFIKEKDFIIDEKLKTISLTEEGLDKAEKIFGFNIFEEKGVVLVHYLTTSLQAQYLYQKDKDYIVKDGKVIIVDEFTGRLLPDRRYSGGLHQALEAKEHVPIKEESRTIATITLQNYFRIYEKLSGMTGTAATSQEEFKKVYNMDVIVIPTNKPMIRVDLPDRIYKTQAAKYRAIVEEVKNKYQAGQPVLIGTPSIEKNELISAYLKRANIPHNVLNAKNHEKEGEIIAQAGKLKKVTVATNMAGRGVDIILGGNPPDSLEREQILKLGGLFVIGTERHEARRIDNQLRGRAGRQGDPGYSQFFLSLEDDLVRIFAPKFLGSLMDKMGWPEDQPIEHPMVSKAIETAQSKIEDFYFEMRKHILEYDDVINKQRAAFYRLRDSILIKEKDGSLVDFIKEIFHNNNIAFPENEYNKKIQQYGEEKLITVFKLFILRILDNLWINQIENMEALRDSTDLRAYSGREPLIEYKKESFYSYKMLEKQFQELTIQNIKNILES